MTTMYASSQCSDTGSRWPTILHFALAFIAAFALRPAAFAHQGATAADITVWSHGVELTFDQPMPAWLIGDAANYRARIQHDTPGSAAPPRDADIDAVLVNTDRTKALVVLRDLDAPCHLTVSLSNRHSIPDAPFDSLCQSIHVDALRSQWTPDAATSPLDLRAFGRFPGIQPDQSNGIDLYRTPDDVRHWKRRGKDGPIQWTAADHTLTVVPGTGDIISTPTFTDMYLHVEWLINEAAALSQDGNSGIKIQERYEVQVLDSPRPGEATLNYGAGSIYAMSAPMRNVGLSRGAWQTYDLFFRAPRWDASGAKIADARISVFWNGHLVQDDVAMPRATGMSGLPESPGPFGILLQDHGAAVQYRAIHAIPPPLEPDWITTMDATNRSMRIAPSQSLSSDERVVAPDGLPGDWTLDARSGVVTGSVAGDEHGFVSLRLLTIGPGGQTESVLRCNAPSAAD